jgi:hypothetical protein
MEISGSAPAAAAASSSAATSLRAPAANSGLSVSPSDNPTIVQMKQFAAILADGSGASQEDKVNAYIGLRTAMVSGAVTGATENISKADADAINAAYDNSAVSTQIRQAADAFSAKGMALVGQIKTVNVASVLNDAFNAMPASQQQMIYAGMATPSQSLADYQKQLQTNADAEAANLAASAPAKPFLCRTRRRRCSRRLP